MDKYNKRVKEVMSIPEIQEHLDEILDLQVRVFIADDKGERVAVIVPMKEWEALQEVEWMYEDLKK